jgi:hypothetical protein
VLPDVTRRGPLRRRLDERALHGVHPVAVQVEEAPEELDDEQQVALTMWEEFRAVGARIELRLKLGQLRPDRRHRTERELVADEVGDQEPEQEVALERDERRGRPRVLAERVSTRSTT